MLSLPFAVVGAVATVALAALSVVGRALTPVAGAVAAVFGIAIVVTAGFPFLILLGLFVVLGSLATRYRFDEKVGRKVQEGESGERGVSNVLAHILIPAGLAVAGGLSLLKPALVGVLYVSALSFAGADTLASEFGVLAGKARSILTFRPVPPGTNGGISGLGQASAAVAAIGTAGVGLVVFALFSSPLGPVPVYALAVVAAGFLGCQVDSVLGAGLENRGWLSKGSTNFLSMLAGVAIAALVIYVLGGVG
jgi:uncharacterized protein (TIGR00297 family)